MRIGRMPPCAPYGADPDRQSRVLRAGRAMRQVAYPHGSSACRSMRIAWTRGGPLGGAGPRTYPCGRTAGTSPSPRHSLRQPACLESPPSTSRPRLPSRPAAAAPSGPAGGCAAGCTRHRPAVHVPHAVSRFGAAVRTGTVWQRVRLFVFFAGAAHHAHRILRLVRAAEHGAGRILPRHPQNPHMLLE